MNPSSLRVKEGFAVTHWAEHPVWIATIMQMFQIRFLPAHSRVLVISAILIMAWYHILRTDKLNFVVHFRVIQPIQFASHGIVHTSLKTSSG